jgi:hypothetical protein
MVFIAIAAKLDIMLSNFNIKNHREKFVKSLSHPRIASFKQTRYGDYHSKNICKCRLIEILNSLPFVAKLIVSGHFGD